ncbi:hypothetical protein BDFB_001723 [Asbolus verrucosus]|uniref:Rotatin n=1 Tax=Asbolus verrucosus TaxID=1661398 RepID=A0A482WA30_ASBVE|nr:hypothetical protein BDFB_001723 [Asbolus verrucosus]
MKQLKDFYIKLSLESVDCLRRILDKKRVCPVLKELDELVGLITNFMVGDETVKCKLTELGLSDLIHKLWSTLFQSVARLHPAITKKQKPWDCVELIWLEFLQTLSLYPEGQSNIAKINDVFEIVLALTFSTKTMNKITALLVLRNLAFYQPNRARLLTSGEFLNLLGNKLETGTVEEKSTIVLIMWSLAANNQKAKIMFKAAHLDMKLQQVLKHYQLSSDLISGEEIERMEYVLSVIRDEDKIL